DEQAQPERADSQIQHHAEGGRLAAQAVQLSLRQKPASGKQEVRARSLRRDRGEIVRREQKLKRERRRRHAQLDADVEEHAEEGEQVRRLTDEDVVQEHVSSYKHQTRQYHRHSTQRSGEPLTEVAHETELVELTAQREQHGEPYVGGEHVAFFGDIVERQNAGSQEDSQP